jgi:DNA-binding transcriptional LysR family regulator
MDVEKIKALFVAVELGSLNKAAEALQYTQAGLTHMMNSLEKEVGFQLLHRGYNGVSLTEDAKRLAPTIRKLIRDYDTLNTEIEQIRNTHKDTIHVASLASVAIQWLPAIIQRFSAKHPNVNIDFRMVDLSNAIEQLLGREGMDIVFTSTLNKGNYDWIHLKDDPLYAVLPPDYDNGGESVFKLEKFDGMDFFVASQGYDVDMMHTMESVSAKPNYKPTSIDDQALINLIEHGMGVTILPELAIRGRSDNVQTIPVYPQSYRNIGIAVRFLEKSSSAIQDFIKEAQMLVADNEGNC